MKVRNINTFYIKVSKTKSLIKLESILDILSEQNITHLEWFELFKTSEKKAHI